MTLPAPSSTGESGCGGSSCGCGGSCGGVGRCGCGGACGGGGGCKGDGSCGVKDIAGTSVPSDNWELFVSRETASTPGMDPTALGWHWVTGRAAMPRGGGEGGQGGNGAPIPDYFGELFAHGTTESLPGSPWTGMSTRFGPGDGTRYRLPEGYEHEGSDPLCKETEVTEGPFNGFFFCADTGGCYQGPYQANRCRQSYDNKRRTVSCRCRAPDWKRPEGDHPPENPPGFTSGRGFGGGRGRFTSGSGFGGDGGGFTSGSGF